MIYTHVLNRGRNGALISLDVVPQKGHVARCLYRARLRSPARFVRGWPPAYPAHPQRAQVAGAGRRRSIHRAILRGNGPIWDTFVSSLSVLPTTATITASTARSSSSDVGSAAVALSDAKARRAPRRSSALALAWRTLTSGLRRDAPVREHGRGNRGQDDGRHGDRRRERGTAEQPLAPDGRRVGHGQLRAARR
jgi:hypothetical protein